MPAYTIGHVSISDPERYEEYRRIAPDIIERFGGRYVVRGGRCEVLEGDWDPERVVVLEFDSVEQAKRWHASAEYRQARAIRDACSATSIVVVEGIVSVNTRLAVASAEPNAVPSDGQAGRRATA